MHDTLTPDAEVLLLILAAAGGSMTKPDAEAEFARVMRLEPDQRAAWARDAQTRAAAAAQRLGITRPS